VGTLTITGVQPIFGNPMRIGSPISILQRGTETAEAGEQTQSSPPNIVYLAPFSSSNPQLTAGKFVKK
jgi:hypothetical protein